MTTIYGLDTSKPYDAVDVRDAMVQCFVHAHKNELDDSLRLKDIKMSDSEFQRMKEINVQQMIRNYFKEVGGDFDNPDKKDIIKVMDKLAEFAKNFRNQKTVKENYIQIQKLANGLN